MVSSFSLVAPPEVIEEVASWKQLGDVRMGRAQPASTLIDAVDAPIGPESIVLVLSTVTVICGTAKALVELVDKIVELLQKKKSKEAIIPQPERLSITRVHSSRDIVIYDPRSGREIARVSETSTREEILEKLEGE